MAIRITSASKASSNNKAMPTPLNKTSHRGRPRSPWRLGLAALSVGIVGTLYGCASAPPAMPPHPTSASTDPVRLRLINPVRPMVLEATDDSAFTYLVMPLRLDV